MSYAKQKTSYWNLAIFLLVILVLVAGAYYFWMSSEKKSESPAVNENIVINTNQNINLNTNQATLKNYKNTDYYFIVDYPSTWSMKTNVSSSDKNEIFTAAFTTALDQRVSLSVMPEGLESAVRDSININTENDIKIDAVNGKKLDGTNTKDGSPVTIILVKLNNRLYSFNGQSNDINEIIKNFSFLR